MGRTGTLVPSPSFYFLDQFEIQYVMFMWPGLPTHSRALSIYLPGWETDGPGTLGARLLSSFQGDRRSQAFLKALCSLWFPLPHPTLMNVPPQSDPRSHLE